MKKKAFLITVLSITILLGFLSGCVAPPEKTVGNSQEAGLSDSSGNSENGSMTDEKMTAISEPDSIDGTETGALDSGNETGTSGLGPIIRGVSDDYENRENFSIKKIRVGAFNVQVFGISKASDPEVMDTLAKIIRTYDVIAIQEIRDKSQTALPELVELVNTDGVRYSYIVSERLGRTSSKEQYAYIYDCSSVRPVGKALTYPEPDGTDPFHRDPYIASFETLEGDFDFTLITVHTDPDEATGEINALADVAAYAREIYPDEDDFMVMGDFNADGSYFDENGNSSLSTETYSWLINNSADTTTKASNCTYDRIVISDSTMSEFTGTSGVFRYDLEYNLSYNETIAVSDHYPVYGEFWCKEESA
ncbi:MAG: endonuclease/exonuclease/phosphatase family protein [Methanosarcinaceae archaeon]|nr:endonuclease/exonuclease/phosphatase family protein [Methanosarcinaceae archaeon]